MSRADVYRVSHSSYITILKISLLTLREYYFCLCIWLFFLHVCLCTTCRPSALRSPGIGVRDGCKSPCGCWELKSSPLQGQPSSLSYWTISPASSVIRLIENVTVFFLGFHHANSWLVPFSWEGPCGTNEILWRTSAQTLHPSPVPRLWSLRPTLWRERNRL